MNDDRRNPSWPLYQGDWNNKCFEQDLTKARNRLELKEKIPALYEITEVPVPCMFKFYKYVRFDNGRVFFINGMSLDSPQHNAVVKLYAPTGAKVVSAGWITIQKDKWWISEIGSISIGCSFKDDDVDVVQKELGWGFVFSPSNSLVGGLK